MAQEVPRPSLDALFDSCAEHRLTIVSAGPGWGKTTAAARWVRQSRAVRDRATAWLTLGERDNTPTLFWAAVLAAVRGAGVLPEGHLLSRMGVEAGQGEEVLRTIFGGLRELPEPLLLILDDFHVIDDPAILDAVANLVAHDTPVNLMLLTRWDPALPLHRFRLSGALAEVRAADLAFDTDAVVALAVRTESVHPTPEQVSTLLARTEGWPAGIRLGIMYLAREGDDAALEGFGGTESSVAEFLLAEVLTRHDADTIDFLLRTSVVEWLSGGLAEAIAPGGRGLSRLEMLADTDSFVTCIDTDRGIYRIHPLLRDLLRHRLRRDDPATCRAANRAAARWLDGADEPVEALVHAVEAEDWQLTEEIYCQAAPWLITGHRFRLAKQLQKIPYATLPPTAGLELCQAGLELVAGRYDALATHVESARRMVRNGQVLPPVGLALMEVLGAVAARESGNPQRVVDAATAALTHLAQGPPSPAVERLRPIALHERTVGYLMLTGDAASALDVFTSVADADQGPPTLISFNVRVYQAWCLALVGRLDDSEAAAGELLREGFTLGWASTLHAVPAHLSLAMVHLLRAEEPEAYRAVMVGLAAAADVAELWPTVALHLARASIAVARLRPRAAVASFENAVAARRARPVPRVLTDMWSRTHADVVLLVGDDSAIPPLQDDGAAPLSATGWSSRARRALARGDLEAAETAGRQALEPLRSEDPAEDLGDLLAAIEARLVLASVAHQRRRPHDSAVSLREALALARPQRLVRPLLGTDPGKVAAILQNALAGGVVQANDFVETVHARLDPRAPLLHEPDPLIEPLTERELAVLAELPTWKSNAEIAAEFYVSVNTVKSHLQHLFRKLDVPNRRQAVRRARELGLIP